MPTKTWAAGDDFNAVDINSYLQNQMVLQFTNAADRATEIPNPKVGMVSFLANTGGFEIFTDKTTPPSWRPPWNLPWGLIKYILVPDLQLVTGDQWILQHLPTPLAGRKYRIEFYSHFAPGNVGTVEIKFQTQAGFDTLIDFTNYQGWNQRIRFGDTYVGGPTIDIGIIGKALLDAVTANSSWGRAKVSDVGPV